MISVFQIWTSIGTLIGTVVDNGTHDMEGRDSYLIPLGVIFVVPVLMSIGLFFIPESPRWLILVDKPAQAEKALLWMRPHPESVPGEVAEIQAAIDAEKAVKSSANFLDIWRDPVDRRRTLLAVAAISTQAASGAMFVIAYGTYFFQVSTSLLSSRVYQAKVYLDGKRRQPLHELLHPRRSRRRRSHGQ
jgi:SP family sugar:H+ symporter-like MFS transporter